MAQERKLIIKSKDSCIKFFDAISKINETVILTVSEKSDYNVTALTSSSDNTLIFFSETNNIEANFTGSLNIPDLKKLTRVLESIPEDNITLKINTNSIEYKSKSLNFKYHLYEEGLIAKPALNINKIKEFTYDVTFNVKKEALTSLLRSSSFSSETNKLYLFTEDDRLKGELTDRSRHNSDAICLDISEADFTLDPLPINLDNIKLITAISDNLIFNINKTYGVTVVDILTNSTKLKYIITSLTQ